MVVIPALFVNLTAPTFGVGLVVALVFFGVGPMLLNKVPRNGACCFCLHLLQIHSPLRLLLTHSSLTRAYTCMRP
jgi:hypothetical protein